MVDPYYEPLSWFMILSLVRSNKNGNVGFLKTDNRVCVALSRAKKGFFCFGNFSLLKKSSELWDNIVNYMEKLGKIGSGFELYCSTHPDKKAVISTCGDFSNVPDGGCKQKCVARLDCGHTCALHCHPKDPNHREYLCKKPCPKKCDMGHPCIDLCHKPCPKCMIPVPKMIPRCKHTQPVPCHMDPSLFSCQAACEKKCSGGHNCDKVCSQPCGLCKILVTRQLLCGHSVEVSCHQKSPKCEQLVSKVLPQCGHEHSIPCHMDPCDYLCEIPCEKKLQCGHRCINKCGLECVKHCSVEVKKIHPVCGHKVSTYCSIDVLQAKCSTKVKRTLFCGHEVTVKCSDKESDIICTNKVTLTKDCGHKFVGKCCDKADTNCKELVSKTFPSCGHVLKLACSTDLPSDCDVKCTTTLLCGHKCIGTCSECHQGRMHKSCEELMNNPLPCGHKMSISCAGVSVPVCKDPCKIKCSHRLCTNSCFESCLPCFKPCEWNCRHYKCMKKCHEPCDRPPCDHQCPKRLPCGHNCMGLCGEKCPDVCRICDKERFSNLCMSKKHRDGNRYIQLECGHMFEFESFKKWIVKTYEQNEVIKMIRCPAKNCEEIVRHSFRFNHIIKEVRKCIIQTQNPQFSKEAEASYKAFQRSIVQLIDKFILQLKSISDKESHKTIESFTELRKFVGIVDMPSVQKIQDILCEYRRLSLLFLINFLQKVITEKGLCNNLTKYKELFDSYGVYKQQVLTEKEATEYFDILQKEAMSILGYCPIGLTDVIVEKPKIARGVWMRCSMGHCYCNPMIPKGFNCDLKHDSCPDCATSLRY